MSDTRDVITAALRRCRRVSGGVDELLPLFSGVMPFGGDDLATLTLIERTAAVAFLKRFEQLQDLVGRLARAVAAWEGQDVGAMSQRDVGDWLEKRRFVAEAEGWMHVVRLRNRLVHEYPVEEVEQVVRLNETWVAMPSLQATLHALDTGLQSQELGE